MNKKLLSVAIAGAMATPMAAQAVKYKLSGQVNRAIIFQDDGEQSDYRSVDNQTSGTRFRLRGSEDIGSGMKVGFYWELQTSSAPSGGARPDQNTDAPQNTNNLRQANVWFSGNWGKLTMGQTDGAGNGSTESDLSGTAISSAYSSRTSWTAGMPWRSSAPGGAAFGLTAGATAPSLDSFSRYDAVKYDSPALGPVTVSASIGNDSLWEVAGRVDTALAGGQLSAALFYGEDNGSNTDSRYGGSASYLFSQGTSVTASMAWNEQDNGADQSKWYLKLGHKWGPHAVSLGYGQNNTDISATANVDDMAFNAGYVYSMRKANTELYAGFTHQELDLGNAAKAELGVNGAQDINVFGVGARVKFN